MRNLALEDELSALSRHLISPLAYWRTLPVPSFANEVKVGGTYRRWIETESARSRASSALQREVLAAACLLQLGSSGERRRLPRSVLEIAVAKPETATAEIHHSVDALIEARLLLWRRHNDDVAVWHGADIDVALRVREERGRREIGFDLRSFLEERFPAPHVRAPGHNAEFGVNRFLIGRYATLDEMKTGIEVQADQAGVIVYLLPGEKNDISAAKKICKQLSEERIVVVVPNRLLEVESAAIELVSIEALREDKEFIASDPMVVTEIHELQSVAFEQLATLMRGLLDPKASNSKWYAEGRNLEVTADRPGTVAASRLLKKWFHSTPVIANEQLMRANASRTMQTARVRVVSGILERSDRERLGYEAEDRSAEGSIYRTVLENTGLRPAGSSKFTSGDAILDPGLKRVWQKIETFFHEATTTPGKPYKSLSRFVDVLASAPTGVPRAVMPVLMAAGFRQFARAVAVYRDGVFVPDHLRFAFDAMVSDPAPFTIRVVELSSEMRTYLEELCYTFTHERPAADVELIGAVHEAINRWLLTVPDGSRRSTKMSARAKAVFRVLTTPSDPVEMLLRSIPDAFGSKTIGPDVVRRVESARMEIDGLKDVYADEAVAILREGFRGVGKSDDVLDVVKGWSDCFDAEALDRRGDLRIVEQSVLRKCVETINGRFTPKSLANALSSILLQRSLDKWDDRTGMQFRSTLRDARQRVEAAALDTSEPSPSLRPIVEAKMSELAQMLAKMSSVEENEIGGLKVVGSSR